MPSARKSRPSDPVGAIIIDNGGKPEPWPDAFDYARDKAGKAIANREDSKEIAEELRRMMGSRPGDTQTVNALLADNWPQHTAGQITATISALQALFELLPIATVAARERNGGLHHPPYVLSGELARAIEMLRSYRLAAETVHRRDEQREQQRRMELLDAAYREADERVRAAITETESRMTANCEQLIAAAKKELRRGKRRSRK